MRKKEEWPRYSFAALLAYLVFVILITPYFQSYGFFTILTKIVISLMLIFSVYVVSDKLTFLIPSSILAFLSISTNWMNYYLESWALYILFYVFIVLFFCYTVSIMIYFLFKEERVTADAIYAAACIYLLLGIGYAFVYACIEHIYPASFKGGLMNTDQSSMKDLKEFFYFSYVTITTLGYGDIVPKHPLAKSFASIEAFMGQFFLTIFLARLVGMFVSPPKAKK